MSTHSIRVIRVDSVEDHPNADRLDLVKVWGYVVAVRKGDFKVGDLAVYIEPDYIVPEGAEWASFLKDRRIRAKRLRGIWSQGLLIPAMEGMAEGDDVMEQLGIIRYEPTITYNPNTEVETPPPQLAHVPKYDLENWRKYRNIFSEDETVYATEKVHGSSQRVSWVDGRMWVGSRTLWKREDESSPWWQAVYQNPWITEWCEAHPEWVLFGEVFGWVQSLRYGASSGDMFFRAFDIRKPNLSWMDAVEFHDVGMSGLTVDQRVPLVYTGPHDHQKLVDLSLMDSVVSKTKQIAEGIVIKPERERYDSRAGRVALKLVSDRYLEKS